MDGHIEMYVPIYPARLGQEPQPREPLALLLAIFDDDDRERLLEQAAIGEVPCGVSLRAGRIHPGFVKILEEKYPGIQVRNCRLVTVGLHEPTVFKARRSWWYGIVSLLLGAALLGWWVWSRRPALVRENTDVAEAHSTLAGKCADLERQVTGFGQ